jgi:excisionase family DNA binding protein
MAINPEKDYSKKEAAEISGISEKTIHRACIGGQLPSRREPLPGGGEKVLIKGSDLQTWLDTRSRPTVTASLTRQGDIPPDLSERLTAGIMQLAQNQNDLQAGQLHLAEILNTMRKQLGPAQADTSKRAVLTRPPLTDRLTVTPGEAAKLSGMPEREIREAIGEGKLKAIKRARGNQTLYRIMREDLSEWLKSLRD